MSVTNKLFVYLTFCVSLCFIAYLTVSPARAGQSGIASYYWQPQAVACGGRFNPNALTAAHKTYPCGSRIRVTNKRNGKSVVVTVNDRGPFVKGRIVDLSLAAAKIIGMTGSGLVPVTVEPAR